MEKKVNLTCYEVEAVQVSIDVVGIDRYMEALTVIFNNVRDRSELYRVSNNSRSTIYVDCRPDSLDAVKEWLGQFGEVKEVGKSLMYTVYVPDYDLDRYVDAFAVAEE